MEEDFAAIHRIDTAPPPVVPSSKAAPAPRSVTTSSSLAKLEPFILLAKSAKGAGAATLVDKVLSASGVYTFAEFLELKNIRELQDSEHKAKWRLLQIFAYGTLKDYRDNAGNLPELSKPQLFKLRQLTLVDMASKTRSLPYSLLMSTLKLSSVRKLEEVIVECIYSDLFAGRINQKQQILEIDRLVLGRDVKLQPASGAKDVSQLIAALGSWYHRVGDTLSQLDSHINLIHEQENYNANVDQQQREHVQKVLSEVSRTSGNKSSHREKQQHNATLAPEGSFDQQMSAAIAASMADVGGGGGEGVEMEVDEKAAKSSRSPNKAQNRKRTRQ